MKNSAYYRSVARELMADRWTIYGIGAILVALISVAASMLLGTIATFLITGAFSLSFSLMALAFIKGQDIELGNIFDGFKNFVNATVLYLHQAVVVFLWSLLLVVPGIVKSLSYYMVFYILAENPEMSSKEAMEESKSLMEGHRWEFFKLELSFIGWGLLSVLTLGILMIWVAPYMNIATAVFYTDLKMAKYGTSDPYTKKEPEFYCHGSTDSVPADRNTYEQGEDFGQSCSAPPQTDFTVPENDYPSQDE